ncbi:hypothetical protein DEU56DRAFT_753694 [Suillus clintonianus]|uniref:uncharacterized protein n=1 Tax=Suillus clintonianus TaxID=1904413 RepID=UPI001B86786D|nr:uncharacterized protein DEU56DRAFT_753694 [Suillus clintonianus]KAG2146830.1 hypothetical protein DEU56DRAFT_753694 [Suillus clintonianus]
MTSMTGTPQPYSGYASPITATSFLTSLPGPTSKVSPKQKPVNVFSDDGSFLERFQRSKKEGEDKRRAEEALARQVDRFFRCLKSHRVCASAGRGNLMRDFLIGTLCQRKRGKRPQLETSSALTQGNPAKKFKAYGDSLFEFDCFNRYLRNFKFSHTLKMSYPTAVLRIDIKAAQLARSYCRLARHQVGNLITAEQHICGLRLPPNGCHELPSGNTGPSVQNSKDRMSVKIGTSTSQVIVIRVSPDHTRAHHDFAWMDGCSDLGESIPPVLLQPPFLKPPHGLESSDP